MARDVIVALLLLVLEAIAHRDGGLLPPESRMQVSAPVPTVVIRLHAAGGDAIDLYWPTERSDGYAAVSRIADAIAPDRRDVHLTDYTDYFDERRAAGAQYDGRLAQRTADGLAFSLNSNGVTRALQQHAIPWFNLAVCAPDSGLTVTSDRPPEHGAVRPTAGPTFDCRQWLVAPDRGAVNVSVTMRPDAGDYGMLLAGFAGLALLGTVLAVLVAMVLRRRVVTTLGAGALLLSAAGGGAAVAAVVTGVIVLSVVNMPVSALAIARDLSQGQHVLATALPVLLLAVPGVVFAAMMARTPPDLAAVTATARQPSPAPSGPGMPTWLSP